MQGYTFFLLFLSKNTLWVLRLIVLTINVLSKNIKTIILSMKYLIFTVEKSLYIAWESFRNGNCFECFLSYFDTKCQHFLYRVQTTIPCDIESYGLTDFRLGCISRIVSCEYAMFEVHYTAENYGMEWVTHNAILSKVEMKNSSLFLYHSLY